MQGPLGAPAGDTGQEVQKGVLLCMASARVFFQGKLVVRKARPRSQPASGSHQRGAIAAASMLPKALPGVCEQTSLLHFPSVGLRELLIHPQVSLLGLGKNH